MECSQPDMIAVMVKNALENSGASEAVLKKVQTHIDQIKSTTGKVNAVITNAKERKIMAGTVWFFFPLNAGNFEAELIRAQDTERTVTVNYLKDGNDNNLITDVWLYSKEAYPDRKAT